MTAEQPRTPLAGFTERLADASTASAGRLVLTEERGWGTLNLRVPTGDLAAYSELLVPVLGVSLPVVPNTVATGDQQTVLWLGPDEWLVRTRGDTAVLEAAIREALSGRRASIVDLSAARAVLRLSGESTRAVLAHGCALDLDDAAFPTGRCAQTRLALANVVLLRPVTEPPMSEVFLVLVAASFGGYLATWLLDAATEYLRTDQPPP